MTTASTSHPEPLQRVLELLPPQLSKALAVQPTEVVVAGLVGVVTLLLLLVIVFTRKKGRGGSVVLVAGPCAAGKTTLFYQLRDGTVHNGTVASMQENTGSVTVTTEAGKALGTVTLVDVPGHERLRNKLDTYLKSASAVVFVIDSVDITPNKVEAAEELFEILTHPAIASSRTPILLASNKSDLELEAHSVEFVKRTLEKQVDAMRRTRTSLSPEASSKAAVLGKPDKPFTLAGLRCPVTIAAVSALKGDVQPVHDFLAGARVV